MKTFLCALGCLAVTSALPRPQDGEVDQGVIDAYVTMLDEILEESGIELVDVATLDGAQEIIDSGNSEELGPDELEDLIILIAGQCYGLCSVDEEKRKCLQASVDMRREKRETAKANGVTLVAPDDTTRASLTDQVSKVAGLATCPNFFSIKTHTDKVSDINEQSGLGDIDPAGITEEANQLLQTPEVSEAGSNAGPYLQHAAVKCYQLCEGDGAGKGCLEGQIATILPIATVTAPTDTEGLDPGVPIDLYENFDYDALTQQYSTLAGADSCEALGATEGGENTDATGEPDGPDPDTTA